MSIWLPVNWNFLSILLQSHTVKNLSDETLELLFKVYKKDCFSFLIVQLNLKMWHHCLPSTCQSNMATVTWTPCYSLSVPAQCFARNWTLPVPHNGGDLTSHFHAHDPASYISLDLMQAFCFVGFPCSAYKESTHLAMEHNKRSPLIPSIGRLANSHISHQTHPKPWRGSCCFTCISTPREG